MNEPENWHYEPAADLNVPWGKRPASELREPGLPGTLGNWMIRRLVRFYLRTHHPIFLAGAQHLPRQTPFVLVANHASHLDALVLQSLFPDHLANRVFALAAGDYFFDTPGKRLAAAQIVNALPVWRGRGHRHALANLRQRLEGGHCSFIVFPEGTRSRTGELQPFKPGIGILLAGSSVPVIPCSLQGCFTCWPSHHRFPRPGPIHLTIHPARTFAGVPNNREGWERIAAELGAAVSDQALAGPLSPRRPTRKLRTIHSSQLDSDTNHGTPHRNSLRHRVLEPRQGMAWLGHGRGADRPRDREALVLQSGRDRVDCGQFDRWKRDHPRRAISPEQGNCGGLAGAHGPERQTCHCSLVRDDGPIPDHRERYGLQRGGECLEGAITPSPRPGRWIAAVVFSSRRPSTNIRDSRRRETISCRRSTS